MGFLVDSRVVSGEPWVQSLVGTPGREGNLGLCTESLGSENGCEWGGGEYYEDTESEEKRTKMLRKEMEGRNVVRRFPPPLPSLMQYDENGLRATRTFSVMHTVRKDGCLIITEIKAKRPDILHATRKNGRFILNLIRCPPEEKEIITDDDVAEVEEMWKCHGIKNVDCISQFGKINNPRFVMTA